MSGGEPQDLNIDVAALAGRKAKGRRPWYFESREAERIFAIVMALAGELSVCRARLDTLERLLASKGVIQADEIESFELDKAAEQQRAEAQRLYIARIFRIIQQEMEGASEGGEADLGRIAEELSKPE
ncbi:MAG: hypothetical protein ISN29_03770 [Gammaproteobacteria bacterium AqS3]|nr:hypothetical protein [Gammaproteobacteria bacterium AqS3]